MIEMSKEANPNYVCKVVKLENLRKHNNADRLQIATVDFQDVVVGLDVNVGDLFVFFPAESKINADFLSHTNSFREKTLNQDSEKAGFFESKGRVKAIKLRGEKSMGYLAPVSQFDSFIGSEIDWGALINEEFDTINGIKIVSKYVVYSEKRDRDKQGKSPALTRLIDGQVHLHVDTENLRKNVHKLNLDDTISITYKTHGTSWWVGNVLVKKRLSFAERILNRIGFDMPEREYDLVYGSRRVVKNKYFEDPKASQHFYGYDLWKDIRNELEGKIPKGYTLYGECLGFTQEGKEIQKGYDYGCSPGQFKIEVYRITHTTEDGLVTELTYPQIVEFCERSGLTPSYKFFYGSVRELACLNPDDDATFFSLPPENWRENLVRMLESKYNEKDCFMCINKVPEEGIVVRKDSLFSCEPFKLKSFRFLEWETKQLDEETVNLEDDN